MNKGDTETCDGCVGPDVLPGLVGCGDCVRYPGNKDSDHELPDHFKPSLQCRQVRALERIADSLEQSAKWRPTLREDEWVKTMRRPLKPCPKCGGEFIEAKFTKLTVPEIGRYGDAAWNWADCVAQCDDCGREGPEAKGEQAALDAWDKEIAGDA